MRFIDEEILFCLKKKRLKFHLKKKRLKSPKTVRSNTLMLEQRGKLNSSKPVSQSQLIRYSRTL